MGYWRYMAKEARVFFPHAAGTLGAGLAILLVVWIISPFEDALRVIATALLGGVLSILLIWTLYMIIGYHQYKRVK